jgi:hypothetical protein
VKTRLVRVWLVIALVDFLFATALSTLAYGSTFTRLWQGVATTALGPDALSGTALTIAGIVVHIIVALVWSTVFLVAYDNLPALRRMTTSPAGVLTVAAVYGPLIWIVMSMVVIRLRTGRPPAITGRWWIQVVGHIFFVALPIVAMTRKVSSRGND